MKKFTALYFLYMALFFTFFYANTSMLSHSIHEEQTKLTLYFLNIFLEPDQLQGSDIWINPQYKIIINQACNGIIPILFLWAAILAYHSGIWHKILWMISGYIHFFTCQYFSYLTCRSFCRTRRRKRKFLLVTRLNG